MILLRPSVQNQHHSQSRFTRLPALPHQQAAYGALRPSGHACHWTDSDRSTMSTASSLQFCILYTDTMVTRNARRSIRSGISTGYTPAIQHWEEGFPTPACQPSLFLSLHNSWSQDWRNPTLPLLTNANDMAREQHAALTIFGQVGGRHNVVPKPQMLPYHFRCAIIPPAMRG